MKTITDKLDKYLMNRFKNDGILWYGLSELVTKEGTTQPLTITGTTERKPVALNDRFDGVIWHRIISTGQSISEDFSFGTRQAKQYNTTLRTVVGLKVTKGEDLVYKIAEYFPEFLKVDGYDYVNFIPNGINEDHEAVMNTEFVQTQYNKHRVAWNVYAIETNVEYLLCRNACADLQRETA